MVQESLSFEKYKIEDSEDSKMIDNVKDITENVVKSNSDNDKSNTKVKKERKNNDATIRLSNKHYSDEDKLLYSKKELREMKRKTEIDVIDDDFDDDEKQELDNVPEIDGDIVNDSNDELLDENIKNIENTQNIVDDSRDNEKSLPIIEIPQNTRVESTNQLQSQETRQIRDSSKDFTKPRDTHGTTVVPQNVVNSPPLDETGDIDLNKLFSSEVGSESDVVKELFSMENIKVKTELTQNEISIISRLELQASMTQNFYLTKVIKELEVLRVSKERKSRSEFVNSFRGIGDNQSGANVFSKLGNVFKNDKV